VLKMFYAVACGLCGALGAWMITSPLSWYTEFPGGIPHTGPFNSHFIRDLGVGYSVAALGFGWCARHLDRCYPAHIGLTAFFTGHALIHLADLAAGHLPDVHWLVDTPLVFIPALLLIIFALPSVRQRLES